jgi:oligopeptide/dipeptide ABC transporter ATP-binding protein
MLLDAIPDLEMTGRQRIPVAGEVPSAINPPSGCAFHPRCPHANTAAAPKLPKPSSTTAFMSPATLSQMGGLAKSHFRIEIIQQ